MMTGVSFILAITFGVIVVWLLRDIRDILDNINTLTAMDRHDRLRFMREINQRKKTEEK